VRQNEGARPPSSRSILIRPRQGRRPYDHGEHRSRAARRRWIRRSGLSGRDAVERRFPDGKDLLTRKVNEFEGQHRFGGGTDYDCDPHVIDILAGKAEGAADEAQAQHDMLKYECNPDGSTKQGAVLKMVRK